jgi:dethiobiotin synthetase
MKRYFITATGTEIGKTFVTAALVHAAREQNKTVAAYKPVISGFDPHQPEGSDTAVILEALGEAVTQRSVATISPWRFQAPLAPSMAAEKEGSMFPVTELFDWTYELIRGLDKDILLIEGAGGVMVPLDAQHTICDWMMVASISAVLVAGSYLGTISHTLTALETLEHAGIAVRAVIVSETPGSSVSLRDTHKELRKFIPESTAVIALPRMGSYQEASHLLEGLLV